MVPFFDIHIADDDDAVIEKDDRDVDCGCGAVEVAEELKLVLDP